MTGVIVWRDRTPKLIKEYEGAFRESGLIPFFGFLVVIFSLVLLGFVGVVFYNNPARWGIGCTLAATCPMALYVGSLVILEVAYRVCITDVLPKRFVTYHKRFQAVPDEYRSAIRPIYERVRRQFDTGTEVDMLSTSGLGDRELLDAMLTNVELLEKEIRPEPADLVREDAEQFIAHLKETRQQLRRMRGDKNA